MSRPSGSVLSASVLSTDVLRCRLTRLVLERADTEETPDNQSLGASILFSSLCAGKGGSSSQEGGVSLDEEQVLPWSVLVYSRAESRIAQCPVSAVTVPFLFISSSNKRMSSISNQHRLVRETSSKAGRGGYHSRCETPRAPKVQAGE